MTVSGSSSSSVDSDFFRGLYPNGPRKPGDFSSVEFVCSKKDPSFDSDTSDPSSSSDVEKKTSQPFLFMLSPTGGRLAFVECIGGYFSVGEWGIISEEFTEELGIS